MGKGAEQSDGGGMRRVDSATDLSDFQPGSFSNVFALETAFHFDPRAQFLAEAFTVLQPGGRLARGRRQGSWRTTRAAQRGAGWGAARRTAARGVLLRIAAALLRERSAVAELRRRSKKGRVVAKQGLRAAVGINRRRGRHGVGPGGRRGRRGEGDESGHEHHGVGPVEQKFGAAGG